MCHIALLMPLLALPLFWLLPMATAAPIYGAVVVLSIWLYYYVIKSMRQPAVTGREWLLHATGEVVEVREDGRVVVRVGNENWGAHSSEPVAVGDRVAVHEIDGLDLKVSRAPVAAQESNASVGAGGR